MDPMSPWFKFFAGLLAAAIVIHVVVALLEPALPFLLFVAALVGTVQLVRWWRERW
jgi:hypothetical protein